MWCVHRPSYIEGRLRLAENRERQRGKTAAAGISSAVDAGSVGQTPEERVAAEKAAEAHARELLQEELAAKASPAYQAVLVCAESLFSMGNAANFLQLLSVLNV